MNVEINAVEQYLKGAYALNINPLPALRRLGIAVRYVRGTLAKNGRDYYYNDGGDMPSVVDSLGAGETAIEIRRGGIACHGMSVIIGGDMAAGAKQSELDRGIGLPMHNQ